jgi:hypothetical protein
MRKQLIVSGLFSLLVAGAAGCSSDGQDNTPAPNDQEHVGKAEERLVGTVLPAAFSCWPAGPVVFANGVATMPIALWSATPLGMLAFSVPGVTHFAVTAGTFTAGAFVATAGLHAVPITTPFLTGIQAGLVAPIAPLTFAAPAIGPAPIVTAPLLTPLATSTAFLTPFISSSALMFTNLAATAAMTPLFFNVSFAWPATLPLSALNVFAASTAATAAFNTAAIATTTAATSAAMAANTAAALSFSNMLFPLTFVPAVGTLPATVFW